jgi:plasmid stability protein
MAKVKTTLSLDEGLMRRIRVRAARTGRRDSEVLEDALREGLGIIERIRSKTGLGEDQAVDLAHRVVHEGRSSNLSKKARSGP